MGRPLVEDRRPPVVQQDYRVTASPCDGSVVTERKRRMAVHGQAAAVVGSFLPAVVALVLLFSIVLMQSPALFGDSPPPVAFILSLLPFAAALITLLIRPGMFRLRPLHVVLFGSYMALITLAVLRAGALGLVYSTSVSYYRALGWLLVAGVGLAAFARETRASSRARYVEALCWAPVVYVASNIALHLVGFSPERRTDTDTAELSATLLGELGLSGTRVLFPLSSGLNSFGAVAGIALASATLLAWRQHGHRRWIAAIGALVSLYGILAVDSRGALLFSLSAIVVVLLVPRARARGLAGLPFLLPLLPLLLLGFLTATADSSYVTTFSRGGPGLDTGASREVVWGAVVDFLASFQFSHLFGYGSFGQVASGVSLNYTTVFRGYDDPVAASTHNFLLQSILDSGYIGLVVTVALCAVLILKVTGGSAGLSEAHRSALLAAVVCLLLIGVTESVPTGAATDSFTFWLLALAAVLGASQAPAPQPGNARVRESRAVPSGRPRGPQHVPRRVGGSQRLR